MRLNAAPSVVALTGQGRQDGNASFAADDNWAAKLTLGQIIKGKVLRSYGDGRYGVHFGDQQRIVDSGIPLTVGDQLRGRVVGLAERVTIERLPERGNPSAAEEGPISTLLRDGKSTQNTARELHISLQDNEAIVISGVDSRPHLFGQNFYGDKCSLAG